MTKKINYNAEIDQKINDYVAIQINPLNHKLEKQRVGRANQLKKTVDAFKKGVEFRDNFQTSIAFLFADFISYFRVKTKEESERFFLENNFDENFKLYELAEWKVFAEKWAKHISPKIFEEMFAILNEEVVIFFAQSKEQIKKQKEEEEKKEEAMKEFDKQKAKNDEAKAIIKKAQAQNDKKQTVEENLEEIDFKKLKH